MKRTMRTLFLLPLLGLGLGLGLGLAPARQDAERSDTSKEHAGLEIGKPVDASIMLPDIAGKQHKLEDYRGKIVVIDFWSINCPWSKGYEARLKALHERYAKEGIVFLAIDSNKTEMDFESDAPFAAIKKYVEANEIPYPILVDRGNQIADRFAARTTPHVYVLDEKGVLRYVGSIDNDPKGEKGDGAQHYVAQALDALMAKKEVAVPSTKPMGCSIKRVAAEGQGKDKVRKKAKMKKKDGKKKKEGDA